MINLFWQGWHVEAIDCSSSRLVFEGLQNMRNLHYLKYLGNKSLKTFISFFVIATFDGQFWPLPKRMSAI
jgi:hypothetical protein